MTGRTRDYLADLALQKGVFLGPVEGRDQTWASDKIAELKAMPDATFQPLDAKTQVKLVDRINAINKEIKRWTLTA